MSRRNDLNVLQKIPAEDIKSGRHSMAECAGNSDCRNAVAYFMTIEDAFDEGCYDTAYWCEQHKPKTTEQMTAPLQPLQPTKTEREKVLEKAVENARECLDAGYVKQAKACLTNALDWQYGCGGDAEDIVP